MQFYVISDNVDTAMGLRFAGIKGCVVHEYDEVIAELDKNMSDENIAVILITEKLVSLCREYIYGLKLTNERPLIVEIPDRHGNGRAEDSITRYVQEAIGVKV